MQQFRRLLTMVGLLTAMLVVGCQTSSTISSGSNGISSSSKISLTTEQKTFNILQNWDKVGMMNHLSAGTQVGPLNWFAVEPLLQYVRSTDEIYYILASSVEHLDNGTTIVHLRENAKWHNGDDYVAEDMIGFYKINQGEVTNYMLAMDKIDNKTVQITWKPQMEPNDRVKTLLLAVDRVGAVQYNEFKKWIDQATSVLSKSPAAPNGYTGWAPFGKIATADDTSAYMANYTEFKNYNPTWFVATGPYMLDRMTETEMLLKRNPNYWAFDQLKFEYIKATNSMTDLNQIYNMLATGRIDYQDGLAPEATLNQIIQNNPNIAHYKMYDPGSIGIVFNLTKTMTVNGSPQLLWTDKVREAFQYLFERNEIKNAGNPYAVTSWFPLMTMAPSEARKNMTTETYNKIKTYSFDQAKATQLLEEAGWSKVDGFWYNGGTKVSLKIHYDGAHPGMTGVAVAVQAALSKFGIDCILKKASDFNAWFGTASSEAWAYDLSVAWTDLNMSFSFPTGSFIYAYRDITAKVWHLPKFTVDDPSTPVIETNQWDLTLNKADGSGTFRIIDVLDGMYYRSDDELKHVVDDLVYGISEKNYGIQFYQNVTGSFINIGKLDGLPLQDRWATSRNINYVPTLQDDEENFYAVARLNFHFAYAVPFISGDIYPRGS